MILGSGSALPAAAPERRIDPDGFQERQILTVDTKDRSWIWHRRRRQVHRLHHTVLPLTVHQQIQRVAFFTNASQRPPNLGRVGDHVEDSAAQEVLSRALIKDPEPLVRYNAALSLKTFKSLSPATIEAVKAALGDSSPMVRRAVEGVLP